MYDFFDTLNDLLGIFGYLVSAVGFFVVGFAMGRFFLASYPKGGRELQIALALGLFGLLIGITVFASPGSAGAFALGLGLTFFVENQGKKETEEKPAEEKSSKKK
ncbi:MAG: hypothetical protein PGMFKBFP_03245 [Anaerolineales bacterium]|nr:hypothetical protein [Anaerolineales bacterium]